MLLGYGITNLEFATGQDSYLNKTDQVYKDSVAYQDLFGGQAMLTLVTMDEGHTVDELFTPENIEQWRSVEQELRDSGEVVDVVSRLTALEFNDALVSSPSGNPADSVAGKVLLSATEREPTAEGKATRTADSAVTLQRLTAVPADERTLDDPEYIDFLLHDNTGDFSDETVAFVDDFTRTQLRENPETLLTASSIVEVVSDLSEVEGAPHVTPTGEEVRAASRSPRGPCRSRPGPPAR